MTRDEAYGKVLNLFMESDDIDKSDLVTLGRLTGVLCSLIGLMYESNMEIVDRTIGEEEARHLDEEIGRSMQFDNPLSGGGK